MSAEARNAAADSQARRAQRRSHSHLHDTVSR
jgi:hypothetical protein